jgi:Tfp pilus assembly protein PilV
VKLRARADEGFGLVELMIALVILNVGVLAIVAAFGVGRVTITRAAETQTAAAIADKQMELYRAVRYTDIFLDTTLVGTANADSTYLNDPANTGSLETAACSPVTDACTPMRTVSGSATPDNRSYRIDTFIDTETPTNGRTVKRVTVVVRRSSPLQTLTRLTSVFDASTG